MYKITTVIAKTGSMEQSAVPSIVVVGSGMSGVAAAYRLIKSGFQRVRVLEATGRSGGRILTSRLGDSVADLGASYIHGPCEENPVFCLARDYGLLDPIALTEENQTIDCDERPPWIPNWFSSSGQRLSTEDMSPSLGMFNELIDDTFQYEHEKSTSWDSLGHFLKSETRRRAAERWTEGDRVPRKLLLCGVSALLKMECFNNAAHTLDELDLSGFSIFKSLKGLDCKLPGGFGGLIDSLMSELPSDLVSYNRPVRCIHWIDDQNGRNVVEVECDDGERIVADHVIVTVPLGYLKKNYSTLFSPPLPAHKIHSLQKIGFGTADKIFVEFESQWWDADCDVIHLVWQDEEEVLDHVSDLDKSWIRKLSSFTVLKHCESPALCGWIAGREAEYMETLPEEELRESLTKLFQTFTGNPVNAPKRILRSQWFLNSWSCGSYCHIPVGCTKEDLANMVEPLPAEGSPLPPLQVLFAGEATHPIYYSTVHGALLSGWREADRLISHYSCKKQE